MGPRKINEHKTHSHRLIFTRYLLTMSRIMMGFSIINVLSAYAMHKSGLVDTGWHCPVVEDDKHRPPVSMMEVLLASLPCWGMTYLTNAELNAPRRLCQQHLELTRFILIVNKIASFVFLGLDLILVGLYAVFSAVDSLSQRIIATCRERFHAYEYNHVSNTIPRLRNYVRNLKDEECLTIGSIIIAALVLTLLIKYIVQFFPVNGKVDRTICKQTQEKQLSTKKTSNILKHGSTEQLHRAHKTRIPLKRTTFVVLCVTILLSIPWEFARIYQEQWAKRAAITAKGVPPECVGEQTSLWQSLKVWAMWQFSWADDQCQVYHTAVLVNPLLEVTPTLVLTSLLTRCVTTPIQGIFHTLGMSFRLLLKEIPGHWQPVVMATVVMVFILLVLIGCKYRLSVPLFLRVEPANKQDQKKPETNSKAERVCSKSKTGKVATSRDNMQHPMLCLNKKQDHQSSIKEKFGDSHLRANHTFVGPDKCNVYNDTANTSLDPCYEQCSQTSEWDF